MWLFFYFTREIMVLNLMISLLGGLFVQTGNLLLVHSSSKAAAPGTNAFLSAVLVLFLTAGFAASLLLYLRSRKNEIPLYFNCNISLKSCIFIAYGLHWAAAAVVLVFTGFSGHNRL